MNTIVIDRSTEHTSVIAVRDGIVTPIDLGIWSPLTLAHRPSALDPRPLALDPRPSALDPRPSALDPKPSTFIVGTGPGSFAGIRSALAFAQGFAVGSGCEVFGVTSAAAFARQDEPVAVVGDARRGLFWVALFDGFKLVSDIFQVERDELAKRVPRSVPVVSPDWKRISATLTEIFADAASPAPPIDAAALWRASSANPALLVREPLPIYLNPAVRT